MSDINYRRGIKRILILANPLLFIPGFAFLFWSTSDRLTWAYWSFILFLVTPCLWATYALWPQVSQWILSGFRDSVTHSSRPLNWRRGAWRCAVILWVIITISSVTISASAVDWFRVFATLSKAMFPPPKAHWEVELESTINDIRQTDPNSLARLRRQAASWNLPPSQKQMAMTDMYDFIVTLLTTQFLFWLSDFT